MTSTQRVNSALSQLARTLSNTIGRGKALSALEVAAATNVSEDTVTHYCSGRTVPTVEWVMWFCEAYGDTHPQVVAELLGTIGRASGWVPEIHMSVVILDANNDGKVDGKDSRIHEARAGAAAAEYVARSQQMDSDGIRTREEAASLEEIRRRGAVESEAARQVDEQLVGK